MSFFEQMAKIIATEKFLDIIQNAFGRAFKPYYDRKDIDSESYGIREKAKAYADAMTILSESVNKNSLLAQNIEFKDGPLTITPPKQIDPSAIIQLLPDASLTHRAQERLANQEYKKQLNIESVTNYAFEQLKEEPPITNEPVNQDWLNRFFRISEDISNEEMQRLWGKILAGEIKQPNSFSLRTLELMRNLTKPEAELFTKMAQFTIFDRRNVYFLLKPDFNANGTNNELDTSGFLDLMDLGIISSENSLNYYFKAYNIDEQCVFLFGNYAVILTISELLKNSRFNIYKMTKSGGELTSLIDITPPLDYIREFISYLKKKDPELKYVVGTVTEFREDGGFSYESLKNFSLELEGKPFLGI